SKCIKCGLCITVSHNDPTLYGLAFIGRGFDVQVGVPFDETLEKALGTAAKACAEVCPTAALTAEDII
ncbi:MAG: hypothetical protein ACRC2T_01265, partial [Thermoguttaceae bacterium]